jgi:hypothetical protein
MDGRWCGGPIVRTFGDKMEILVSDFLGEVFDLLIGLGLEIYGNFYGACFWIWKWLVVEILQVL